METKHTKGEWTLCQKSGTNDLCRIKDSSGGIIADCFWLGEGRSQAQSEANAKLIAAAPDLLEALQKVKSELMYENLINKEKSSGRNWQVELDIINQVIKKATE